MRPLPRILLLLASASLLAVQAPAPAAPAAAPALAPLPAKRTFRTWMGGEELGGGERTAAEAGGRRTQVQREWITLSRLGLEVRQELSQTATRNPDGTLTFTWRVQLASEPLEGKAAWSPRTPGILHLEPAQGTPSDKEVPAGAALWPEDEEARLRAAALGRAPVHAVSFSFPTGQWATLDLGAPVPDPLPGFPDAVRFEGTEREGRGEAQAVAVWVSPAAGELRHKASLGGLEVVDQRSELPAPTGGAGGAGVFERTLHRLAPTPFILWLGSADLRFQGASALALPEDGQQRRNADGTWHLERPLTPSEAERAEKPVQGRPSPEDAPFLAATPLVQFNDPAFEGLVRRMALPAGLSRWELARRVTAFVYDWIQEKDYSVGFASALEVAHTPKGDCTEHGVLAVALLRKLGVPARGVTGWVGLDGTLGLHFWVEVKLGGRWVPVDPTFDQAPASALRVKLGTTDLEDLGSVGWDSASLAFQEGSWVPVKADGRPWGASAAVHGDTVTGGGLRLRVPGAAWSLEQGRLNLRLGTASWSVDAVARPQERDGLRRLAGARTLRPGRWDAAARTLWVELPQEGAQARWLMVAGLAEPQAYELLDRLQVEPAK